VHECPYFQAKEDVTVSEPKDEMTVVELREYIEAVEDLVEIERLLEEELQRSEPRKTAVKILQDRLSELQPKSTDGNEKAPDTGGEEHDPDAGTESGTEGAD
jgi:glutamate formiminotransferase